MHHLKRDACAFHCQFLTLAILAALAVFAPHARAVAQSPTQAPAGESRWRLDLGSGRVVDVALEASVGIADPAMVDILVQGKRVCSVDISHLGSRPALAPAGRDIGFAASARALADGHAALLLEDAPPKEKAENEVARDTALVRQMAVLLRRPGTSGPWQCTTVATTAHSALDGNPRLVWEETAKQARLVRLGGAAGAGFCGAPDAGAESGERFDTGLGRFMPTTDPAALVADAQALPVLATHARLTGQPGLLAYHRWVYVSDMRGSGEDLEGRSRRVTGAFLSAPSPSAGAPLPWHLPEHGRAPAPFVSALTVAEAPLAGVVAVIPWRATGEGLRLLVGLGDGSRHVAELTAPPEIAAGSLVSYWIALPKPVSSACVSVAALEPEGVRAPRQVATIAALVPVPALAGVTSDETAINLVRASMQEPDTRRRQALGAMTAGLGEPVGRAVGKLAGEPRDAQGLLALVELAARHPSPDAVPVLVEALTRTPVGSPAYRRARKAIESAGAPLFAALMPILGVLPQDDAPRAQDLLEAVHAWGPEGERLALVAWLGQGDRPTRHARLRALLGKPDAPSGAVVSRLGAMLASGACQADPEAAIDALAALEHLAVRNRAPTEDAWPEAGVLACAKEAARRRVRLGALRVLGRRASRESIAWLGGRAGHEGGAPDPLERAMAAEALLRHPEHVARDQWLALLEDPSPDVRLQAGRAVGKWTSRAELAGLEAALLSRVRREHWADIQGAVFAATAQLGRPDGRAALESIAFAHVGEERGERALRALLEAGPPLGATKALKALDDPAATPTARRLLVEHLGHSSEAEAQKWLRACVTEPERELARLEAAEREMLVFHAIGALGRTVSPENRQVLSAVADSPAELELRRVALEALVSLVALGDDASREALVDLAPRLPAELQDLLHSRGILADGQGGIER